LGQFLLQAHITKAGQILNDLKAKGRIPRTAIPVLRERLDIGECICGEKLERGSSRYKHIENLIVQQQAASAVDDRLTDLRLIANQKLSQLSDTSNGWIQQVRSVIERRNELEKHIETLEAALKEIENKIGELPETDIGFLRKQRKDLREYRDGLNREQSIRLSDRDRLVKALKVARDEETILTKQQKRYRKVTSRLDATKDILDVLVTSYKAIEDDEIPRVCAAMNEHFLNMIQADPLHSIIRRADITAAYDIAVYGPEDRRLDTDLDLNGASRRALTLAFILALTEVSGVKAPNVIDTPLGMMSGLVKQSVLQTAVNHTTQLVLFLTRDEISGCQDIIDSYAGKIYPKQLVNNIGGSYTRLVRCDCNHRQYCKICERIGDSDNPALKKRGK
jgi:DNA sulfur modification protein DndD